MKTIASNKKMKYINIITYLKHRNSFFRISVLIVTVLAIFLKQNIDVSANELQNTLSISLEKTTFEISKNTLSLSPVKDKDYTFEVTISNIGPGDSSILIDVFASTAMSDGSAIIYSVENDNILDDKFIFQNYVTIQEDGFNNNQLELAAGESKKIRFTINIPSDINFSGSMLGGINFSQQTNFETDESSVGVKTIFERVISVNLQFDHDRNVKDLLYKDFSFTTGSNVVNLSFNAYNYNPFLGNLSDTYYELKNPKNDIISSGNFSYDLPITAMSIVPLQIPLNDDVELLSGQYELTIATSRKSITTSFTYTKENIESFIQENRSSNSVFIQKNTNFSLIIIICILSIILVTILIYILIFTLKK